MKRFLALAYGIVVYSLSLATLSYAIMFIGNIVVPKTIDSGPLLPLLLAVAVNSLLFGVFAIQHSGMARQGFKRVWTQFVPQPVERTTFVLTASLVLMLLLWQWRAIPQPVWEEHGGAAAVLHFAFWLGWGLVLTSTFLTNHFELFGLSQVWSYFGAKQRRPIAFRKPAFYRLVRHPLYLGLVIAFWSAPRMSVGHLLFSILGTVYILVGIFFEERDLFVAHGEAYRNYREEVPMLIPLLKGLTKSERGGVSAPVDQD